MLGDEVVIHAGLTAGEQVAASGSFKLREAALEEKTTHRQRVRKTRGHAPPVHSPTSSSSTRCSRSSSTW